MPAPPHTLSPALFLLRILFRSSAAFWAETWGADAQAGADLYELVGQLAVGRTGTTKLMRDRRTNELVAAKWVQHTAGETLSVQTEREIVNHRRLLHPNVVRFREVSDFELPPVTACEFTH